jgi:diguanylate cyclase (GGDEF)-like protein/PAS domain S-box-containing protein
VRIRHPTDADTPEYRGGTSTEVQRPANERERLAALRRFEIVDTPEEEAFDRITRLAAAITGAPRAAIGLLDEDRLWFKSGVGVGRVQVARNGSFAAYAILESGVMVVEDALADPRFCDHAFVAGPPHYRFYAGAPIVTRDGFSLGALSVLDTRPRGLTSHEARALQDLAALAAQQIEGRVRLGSESARRQQLESFVRLSYDAAMITDISPDTPGPVIAYVNEAFERLTGYAAAEVIGRSPEMLHGPLTDPAEIARLGASLSRGERVDTEIVNYRKDGVPIWVDLSITPVRDGGTMSFVGIQRDVSGRHNIAEIVRKRIAVLHSIGADAPLDEVFQRTVEFVEFASPSTIPSILSVRDGALHHAASGVALPRSYVEAIDGLRIGPASGSCGTAAYTGKTVIVSDIATDPLWRDYRDVAFAHGLAACWSTPVVSRGNVILGTLAIYARQPRSPTANELEALHEAAHLVGLAMERRTDHEKLERMALYDTLTGLPNRALFEAKLSDAVDAAQAGNTRLALGLIDLDRFKVVNDSLGHVVGDQLLVEVSRRLVRATRPGDTLARMGGDEFVILMCSVESRDVATKIAERAVAQLDPAFHPDGVEVFVRASMGVATFPDDAATADELTRAADRAMYAAKARGGGVANLDASERGSGIARVALETALRHALGTGQLTLHYQVLCDITSGEFRGAEALLRWGHPEFGQMGATELVRLAEETGLILPIGAWVLSEACRQAVAWQAIGAAGFVSVNVSARQFEDRHFADTVVRALTKAGLEPHRLFLEITESLVMRAPETATSTLRALKDIGVQLVVDDFGTGYSNLDYLKRFPLDALKIDKSLISDIGADATRSRDERIVRAIVALADALDLQTIGEGIETEAQLSVLRALGCTLGQGFLLGKPCSADRLTALLRVPTCTPASPTRVRGEPVRKLRA